MFVTPDRGIASRFGQGWVDETLRGFRNDPVSVIVAELDKSIIGFAAYEVTAKAYFGPMGVEEKYRGKGIGKALFLAAMVGLRNMGYVYGFVGSPGPVDFYLKATPGLVLPSGWTNIYNRKL